MALLNVGKLLDNKKMTAAMLGVGAIGLTKDLPGEMIDLGNEAAFGNENADKAFLGQRGLSAGTMLDANLEGGAAVGGTAIGGVLGAAGGGAIGAAAGSMLKDAKFSKDINIPKNFAEDIPLVGGKKVRFIGGKNLFKAGMGGSPKAAAMIGIAGAVVGGGFGAATYGRSYVNRNRDFFQQNPYSRGSAMQAASTSAYGDIVLGMHNSRRG